jgi:transposase
MLYCFFLFKGGGMAGQDIIMATARELRRLHIVRKVIEGSLSQVEAAELLSMSARQIRRLVKRVDQEGDQGILHRSRGKESNRAYAQEVRHKVLELYRQKYDGFGPTLYTEKLMEDESISISDETVRLWLFRAGLWEKSKKRPKHRQWRERRKQRGQLVQIDGSHHDWLEGRGPWCVLMAYIDDATNTIYGRFYRYEGTIPAMDSFLRYTRKNGLPFSVYVDKHTTYKSPAGQKDRYFFENAEQLSQFERAMKELGVEVIHAHSPQAKGRIERLFKTLQDRLVKGMRLSGISSIEAANEFLSGYLVKHNRKFARVPAEKADMHRKVPCGINLKRVLCIKTERTVRNDFTISHDGGLYQVMESFSEKNVMVEERLNGKMEIMLGSKSLSYRKIEARPEKRQKPVRLLRTRPSIPMPADHPYRKTRNLMFKRDQLRKQRKQPVPLALP